MSARDIELRIVGKDDGASAAARKVGREFEQAAKKVDKLNDSIKKTGSGKMPQLPKGLSKGLKVGAGVAGVASLAGPGLSAGLGLAKTAAAFGKAMLSLTPLLGTLPTIAAGVGLIGFTVKAAAPGIKKGVAPITSEFTRMNEEVAKIAGRGLPELSRQFVKVNFPFIERAMRAIAVSTNSVVVSVGKWVNSATGQSMMRKLMEGTADASKRLAEGTTTLLLSIGNLMERLGGRPVRGFADGIARAEEAVARWLDRIDDDDIDKALANLHTWGRKIKETFSNVREVGQWLVDNQEQVKQFSNALAGIGLVVGLATGNWVAVLASSASLIINNWTAIKDTVSGVWNQLKNDPQLQSILESAREAWNGFKNSFKEATKDLGKDWAEFTTSLKRAWEEWGPVIKVWWEVVGKPVLSALGTALGNTVIAVLNIATAANVLWIELRPILQGIWILFSTMLGNILGAAEKAFGWLPVLGPNLRKAQKEFQDFRDGVNAALAGIQDQDVTINIRTKGTAGVTGSNEQFNVRVGRRARGGPVEAGMPYIVGDGGREELFVPDRNGEILPSVPSPASRSGAGGIARMEISGSNSWLIEMLKNLNRTGQLRMRDPAGNEIKFA